MLAWLCAPPRRRRAVSSSAWPCSQILPPSTRFGRVGHSHAGFVVAVQDADAGLAHEVGFGGGIGGEVVVAVEVVGGDVQHGGDTRVEAGAEFELVAGKFDDVAVGRLAVKKRIEHRAADVAAEFGLVSGVVQRLRQECYHGGFAVAAGNRQHGFVVQAREQLDVVDLLRVRVGKGGAAAVNAGADHQRARARERLRVVEIALFDTPLVEALIEADGVVTRFAQEVERDMAGGAHSYYKNRFGERERPQFAGHGIHGGSLSGVSGWRGRLAPKSR